MEIIAMFQGNSWRKINVLDGIVSCCWDGGRRISESELPDDFIFAGA